MLNALMFQKQLQEKKNFFTVQTACLFSKRKGLIKKRLFSFKISKLTEQKQLSRLLIDIQESNIRRTQANSSNQESQFFSNDQLLPWSKELQNSQLGLLPQTQCSSPWGLNYYICENHDRVVMEKVYLKCRFFCSIIATESIFEGFQRGIYSKFLR